MPPVESATPPIDIVPIGSVSAQVLSHLPAVLGARFRRQATVSDPIAPDPRMRNDTRHQWRSDLLLVPLGNLAADRGRWVLGVIDDDLYTPGLTFVFGQARRGVAGVIGLTRLYPAFYGESDDPTQMLFRTEIEAVHELGHVASLDHCPDPGCVMRFSNNIGHTDKKGSQFCSCCQPILEEGSSPSRPRSPAPARAWDPGW